MSYEPSTVMVMVIFYHVMFVYVRLPWPRPSQRHSVHAVEPDKVAIYADPLCMTVY